MSNSNQSANPHHRPDTAFIGELQTFTDEPGGAPLDHPDTIARLKKQRGRPKDRTQQLPPDENETPDD